MRVITVAVSWTPGIAVREARRRARMTQDGLAERLEQRTGKPWSQAAVSKLEHGRRSADWELLAHLEAIFERPLDWFVHGPDDDDPQNRDMRPKPNRRRVLRAQAA